ncbi:universal stress protein [Aquimarina sp. MMG015]|uniref:universal stress protein n=1 Tax=unclassified Aquimarina TaxID=2627091 RepID=UPI000E4EFD97|nr:MULTISPECIES: universal stress protein [unclassified Aquimarina]AXT58207.1 universal stress protein [Aquimarina sp. AD1]MBQ4804968.1 universal stress protein [Aquimarina sp. MMG015]RKN28072.1 universal stress protein [Aquimarina sp. AD1]
MKNILIPTDFSENSWNAITYALSFFEKVQCNFYFLHISPYKQVIGNESFFESTDQVVDNITLSDQEQMQLLLKRIQKLPLNPKHYFFTIHEYIFFIDTIRKQVEEKNIDFIVMGTKGASGLKEKTVGSNTGDVITKVKCPILVIPEKAKYSKINEIAFPTDYNILYKNRILQTITEVLTINKAALRVLHIAKKEKQLTELQKRNKNILNVFLEEDIDHSFHFLSNPSIEQAVQCFVESRDINMITMVAKNLNFFQRILFHPTVEKISYHINIPFLVLHE